MSKSINEATKRGYDGTVARIAGNLLSGQPWLKDSDRPEMLANAAVKLARAIVAETKRTEPTEDPQP